jgi:hypothetical protein
MAIKNLPVISSEIYEVRPGQQVAALEVRSVSIALSADSSLQNLCTPLQ